MEISVNSRITDSMPLLFALLYERFHLMEPKVPSACMDLLVVSLAPNSDCRLLSTSLCMEVSS